MSEKPKVSAVPASERADVARAVCRWLNGYPDKPVKKIDYEYLTETGMTVSTIQAPVKLKSYIDGSYRAQYQGYVIYRDIPSSTDARLQMDEVLDKLAVWAESHLPDLGGYFPIKVEVPNTAAMSARYDDGVEDHQITINIIYEVRK